MAVINDFSYETLMNIFCSLTATIDLSSVSRVSRRWHEICEPVLYREPHLSDCAHIPPSIELFLRTLLAPGCERLASHVRVLDFQWLDHSVDLTPERRSIMDIITAEQSRIGVTHICLPGSQSAHVVLRMHLLPRLQRLVLQYDARKKHYNYIMHGIGPGEPFPLAFQSLTYFRYETSFLSIGVSPKTLLFLLQLPHLRTLYVQVMKDIDRDLFADVSGTSGVTKLTLGYCAISAASLSLILGVPRALEHFTYHGDCVPSFVDILFPLRDSLTYLHLDFGISFDPGQMLNLREWPVLRTLRCSPVLLLGEPHNDRAYGRSLGEVLPGCIRQLGLLDFSDALQCEDFGVVVDAVVHLLGQKWLVPALERLVVETRSRLFRERLRVACEATGVLLADDYSS